MQVVKMEEKVLVLMSSKIQIVFCYFKMIISVMYKIYAW